MAKYLDIGFNKESKLVKIRIRNDITELDFSLTKDNALIIINNLKNCIDMISD